MKIEPILITPNNYSVWSVECWCFRLKIWYNLRKLHIPYILNTPEKSKKGKSLIGGSNKGSPKRKIRRYK